MISPKIQNIIIEIIRVSVGLLFTLSGILKITDLVLFEETILSYNVFPEYSKLLAIIIPSFEVVAGLFLIIGIFKKASIVVLIPLILSFIFAIWINLKEGFIFDCGCLGPLEIFSRISRGKILFNVILIFALILVFFKDRKAINLLDQFKIVITYASFIAMLIYIPYSNASWAYAINVKNIKKIDWKKANYLIQNKNAILFDARINNWYKKSHVPGALSLPFLDFDKYLKKYDDEINKDAFIIVYCSRKNCSAATRTSFKLIARGYTNIFTIYGGFDAWNKKNRRHIAE